MLAAKLIDEVSVLVAPAVDGRLGTGVLFYISADGASHRFALEHMERRTDDLIWLRYRVEQAPETPRGVGIHQRSAADRAR